METRENVGGWDTNENFWFDAPAATDHLQAAPLQVGQEVRTCHDCQLHVEEAVNRGMQSLIPKVVEAVRLQCAQEFKAHVEVMNEAVRCAQEFSSRTAKLIEEVKNMVHSSGLRKLPGEAESSASRNLQLHFVGTLPAELATLNNIQDDGASLMVELRDSSGSRVEVGPESSARIKIVVLDGDFEDRDGWTEEDFNKSIVQPRKGKGPLLNGDCEISLSKGIATVDNISVTDNSSKSAKNGHFKFGAQVVRVKGLPSAGIREAISERFKVKERRGQPHQKHEIPSLEDETWRLKNIANGGEYWKSLAGAKVLTVKDFLQLRHTDERELQNIVKLHGKKWKATVDQAESCVLTNERYSYTDDEVGVHLVLDCVFNIVSITLKDQSSLLYDTLNASQKELVDKLRCKAYEKRSELPKICDPTNQLSLHVEPIYPSNLSQMNMQYANTGETEMQPSFEYTAPTVPPSQLGQVVHEPVDSHLEAFTWVEALLGPWGNDNDDDTPSSFNRLRAPSTSNTQVLTHGAAERMTRSRVKWNSVRAVVVMFRIAIKLSVNQGPRALKKRKLT